MCEALGLQLCPKPLVCGTWGSQPTSQGLGGGPISQIRQQTSCGIWQAASKTCRETPVVLASWYACPSTSDGADPCGLRDTSEGKG